MNNSPVVTLEQVRFAYDANPVVEDVSFSIRRGESICIVGPNGGGKTTLVRLMLGLLQPDTGHIRVLDRPPRQASRDIGYMPRVLRHDLQFPVTVADVVLMGRLGNRSWKGFFGRYGAADCRAAVGALEEVELADMWNRPFQALSGGQRQRVLIARALCCEPEILVLDEPTSNVDSRAEAQLIDILRRLGRRMTIIMVTHDLAFVSGLVERVVCVNRRVVIHPTSELSGETIAEMYGAEVRLVRHDACTEPHGDDHHD